MGQWASYLALGIVSVVGIGLWGLSRFLSREAEWTEREVEEPGRREKPRRREPALR